MSLENRESNVPPTTFQAKLAVRVDYWNWVIRFGVLEIIRSTARTIYDPLGGLHVLAFRRKKVLASRGMKVL